MQAVAPLQRTENPGDEPSPPRSGTRPEKAPNSTLDTRHSYLLSFDDGTEDHQKVVLPLLERHKTKAIFFVPTAKINCPGYLNEEGVREISHAGHTIGLHGHEHRRMDRLTEEDIRVQFEISRDVIAGLTGAPPVFFAPPGGYYDRRVQRLAEEAGVRVTRAMRWGYNRHPDFTALECIPINRYTTQNEFQRISKFQRINQFYSAKELVKKIVPARVYESLRDHLLSRVRHL